MLPDDLFFFLAALQIELQLCLDAARAGCDVQDWRAAVVRKLRDVCHA